MRQSYRCAEFYSKLSELQKAGGLTEQEKTSAAMGYAVFDSTKDTGFKTLFERADSEMYHAKQNMKAVRED